MNKIFNKFFIVAAAATVLASVSVHASELGIPVSKLNFDHVFLIMMENETNTDILGNPNAPFINAYTRVANQATNYFAVGHPSAPNYLEIVGGSNFGVSNDYWPNWVYTGCIDNAPGSTGCNNAVTPIAVPGSDNAVVATATNSTQCNGRITITGTPTPNNCALYNYPSSTFTPKSIADQLVSQRKTWKTYQESLPTVAPGVAQINYSDGAFSNLSPVSVFSPGPIQKLYAVKHDPFPYFRNIEVGQVAQLMVWDENDYSNSANKVVMLVETNYARNGQVSNQAYDHFSLLRTLEAGFGLPCLNHACDSTSKVMNDMFGGTDGTQF